MITEEIKIEKCGEKRWLVVKTKPRCEKKLAEYCLRRDITHYLPLRRSIKRYKYRTVEFSIPMFNGYIFAQIDPEHKLTIQESRQSAQVIVPDNTMEDLLIRELNNIQALILATADGTLIVRPEIEIGKSITVKSGPLSGLTGIVRRRRNKTRITVNVEMIGYSVSMDLDVGEVEIDL